MIYEHFKDLQRLLDAKLITKRGHPTEDLWIYNYSPAAQSLKIHEWSPCLCDCRGLILNGAGEVVGRPFRKFWNYEQVTDQIPSHLPFTVWEKLDGSLGIVCNYQGKRIVATRGSFESDQAKWAQEWLEEQLPGWVPLEGLTYLAEIIYPENRIVVDYGDVHAMKLLAVMEADGRESLSTFYASKWDKAQSYGPQQVQIVQDSICVQDRPGEEGYVLRWANGFRAKVKFEEYKRLHRLITQVSTRSIWELLRARTPLDELVERVPEDFRAWVLATRAKLDGDFTHIWGLSYKEYAQVCVHEPEPTTRKEFAHLAKQTSFPSLVFAIHDGKSIRDMIYKMIEPKWATPFRREVEG